MKLQPLLSEYLLQNESLPLEDAGHLSIKMETAVVNAEDAIILPPRVIVNLDGEKPIPAEQQKLIDFISKQLSVSHQQATNLLAREGNLQIAFTETKSIDWASLGSFQLPQDGTISFVQIDALNNYLPTIALRQNEPQPEIQSFVETNEPEPNDEPIYELPEPIQKDYWWVWAIVVLVISIALILLRFLG